MTSSFRVRRTKAWATHEQRRDAVRPADNEKLRLILVLLLDQG